MGSSVRGRHFWRRVSRLLGEVGDRWQLAIVLDDAAGVALVLGEAERALAYCEESLAVASELEDRGSGRCIDDFILGASPTGVATVRAPWRGLRPGWR